MIEARIPLLDEILAEWQGAIGDDFPGYRNHVYRMVHFCFALHECTEEDRRKVIVAGCFHDLGIWSDRTADYLPPSIARAKTWLTQQGLDEWCTEIALMIEIHHKLRAYRDARYPLVEVFRKADLVDVSLGFVTCGVPRAYITRAQQQFPDAGFHKRLLKLLGGWFSQHPASPPPFFKW